MNANIEKITSLANEIDSAIEQEIRDTQQRLSDSVASLHGMDAVAKKTMLPQIQRQALTESLAAAKQALQKIENAWNLSPLKNTNVVSLDEQKAA